MYALKGEMIYSPTGGFQCSNLAGEWTEIINNEVNVRSFFSFFFLAAYTPSPSITFKLMFDNLAGARISRKCNLL